MGKTFSKKLAKKDDKVYGGKVAVITKKKKKGSRVA